MRQANYVGAKVKRHLTVFHLINRILGKVPSFMTASMQVHFSHVCTKVINF